VDVEMQHGGKACSATEDVETCSAPPCRFFLKSDYDGKCLDVYAAQDEKQGNVYMHDCHGDRNQQWVLDLATGAWGAMPPMSTARAGCAAAIARR